MTNPPDWKQDQAETSRLQRKGKESAQTMLAPRATTIARDTLAAPVTPEEASTAAGVSVATALKDACMRLQSFLDTFGDVGGCETAADINDSIDLTSDHPLAAPPAAQTDGVREALEPFIKPMSRMAAAKMIDPTLGPMTPIDVVVTKHQFASAQIALSVTRPPRQSEEN